MTPGLKTPEEAKTKWLRITEDEPPQGSVVMTKIDDAYGSRNETRLKRIGRLWSLPGDTMYTYYTPTHWRPE